MKILIACEYSGVARDAFAAKGHEAVSCDLRDSLTPGEHHKGDVLDIVGDMWDMMVAFPPCTHLAVSGARWFSRKMEEQKKAIDFFMRLATCDIKKICIENPVSIMSSRWRKPDQIVHPFFFGDSFRKRTCLWLKNLPALTPTNMVDEGEIHVTPSGRRIPKWYSNNKKKRDLTFPGIAQAMADQWG